VAGTVCCPTALVLYQDQSMSTEEFVSFAAIVALVG
jgi:hypothetical protein